MERKYIFDNFYSSIALKEIGLCNKLPSQLYNLFFEP